jgi:pimeloyl-ACP methyl ester carboxylesterase
VRPVAVTVDGIPVSGLVAPAAAPRATLLAVHGGASSAGYFHAPGHDELSLLALGAHLGFTVVALDRPGFGASHGRVGGWSIARRADLYSAALDAVLADGPSPGGTVLVAHSLGAYLAATLAPRRQDVIGLEINGSGLEYRPDALGDSPVAHAGQHPADAAARRRVAHRIWGPRSLYPDGRAATPAPVALPSDEPAEALAWNTGYRDIAAKVRVPVHITMGEFEGIWPTDPPALAEIAAAFVSAPRAIATAQAAGPHNTSLSLAARAYHLHVLAFAEECLLWARGVG